MTNGRANLPHDQISNAARWVRGHLATYCRPGRHTLHHVDGHLEWCTHCYKEMRTDGSTCLICDQPGELEVELKAAPGDKPFAEGRLCCECREGLKELRTDFVLLERGRKILRRPRSVIFGASRPR